MEKSDFDSLMERYVRGEVSMTEKAKIEAWPHILRTEDTSDLELTKQKGDGIFRKLTSKMTSVEYRHSAGA